MTYAVGSLVKARGRDWVVLPSADHDWYLLKPLGGSDAEIACISPALERVDPAAFPLPDPEQHGDARSCALLRDATRLGFRSTSGPFRSFGRIAVEPRPYQLVPLLMALKQEVIRLLIADDVGIGKTVEASLIARELIDRGEVTRMTVLCPPQLAEQWQDELEKKFHIKAELVLPSTVSRLERGLDVGTSLFEVYPFTIVSLDYIKSQRHRDEFLRVCPELVIVDEAHACASATGNKNAQQRYDLVRRLAADSSRHMLFVTATPHSGKDDVFRSLLSFLNPEFESLPDDLAGRENEAARRNLARYFVQRRRGDIRAFMDEATPVPERLTGEITWRFSPAEKAYFQSVLSLARDSLKLGEDRDQFSQRVFWWSALALLRAVTSSPAAAVVTLRSRALGLASEDKNLQQLDDEARQMIYDLSFTDDTAITDTLAGADSSETSMELPDNARSNLRRRYSQLAKMAEDLEGPDKDAKLRGAIDIVKRLLKEGYSPVVFCRFIHTAEYVGNALAKALPRVFVSSVTGMLAPEERENRVEQLSQAQQRVLVCTDCLSEGINLQAAFNAVVHYDLSWNPTRHEQREGRVDRFGQPFSQVKVVTYYGEDNPIDGYVLDVLLRKHESIRKALGISVPFPEDSDKVMQAILQGLLLKGGQRSAAAQSLALPGMEDFFNPEKKRLEQEWDSLAAREQKRSRTVFAQQTVKVDDVAREVSAAGEAAGSMRTVEKFVSSTIRLLGGVDKTTGMPDSVHALHDFYIDKQVLKQHPGLVLPEKLCASFAPPVRSGQALITRTHPLVENLAGYVFDTAMDPELSSVASRSGVMRTDAVSTRTTLLLCRFRYELRTTGSGISHSDLTEECAMLAFSGSPQNAAWLDDSQAKKLLEAEPRQNVDDSASMNFLGRVNEGFEHLLPHIMEVMSQRAETLLDAHRRVRAASRAKGMRYDVSPQGEPDVLGIFVYLPLLNS